MRAKIVKETTAALERVVEIAQRELGEDWSSGEINYWFTGPDETYRVNLVREDGAFGFRNVLSGVRSKAVLTPREAAGDIVRTLHASAVISPRDFYDGVSLIVEKYHAEKARIEARQRVQGYLTGRT